VKSLKGVLKNNGFSLILLSVVLSLAMVLVDHTFLSARNISSVIKSTSYFAVVAFAQMVVLGIGQFCLAIGPIGCLSAVAYAWLIADLGVPGGIAVIFCFVMGTLLGFIHGTVTARTGLHPFIVTLAFQSIIQGLATGLLHGRQLTEIPDFVIAINKEGLLHVGQSVLLPWIFIIMVVVAVVLAIFFKKTSLGHKLLLVGDSKPAARIAGIKPENIVVMAYTLAGLISSLGGLLGSSRNGCATVKIGNDWILYSFAAPVLGGTLLSGGQVNVFGAVGGALLVQVINYALSFMGVDPYWMQTVLGLLLVTAFSMDYIRGRLAIRATLKETEREIAQQAAMGGEASGK